MAVWRSSVPPWERKSGEDSLSKMVTWVPLRWRSRARMQPEMVLEWVIVVSELDTYQQGQRR